MLFGVLSAIASVTGVTAAAQDLMRGDATARQNESVVQIQEVRQEAGLNFPDWDLRTADA